MKHIVESWNGLLKTGLRGINIAKSKWKVKYDKNAAQVQAEFTDQISLGLVLYFNVQWLTALCPSPPAFMPPRQNLSYLKFPKK